MKHGQANQKTQIRRPLKKARLAPPEPIDKKPAPTPEPRRVLESGLVNDYKDTWKCPECGEYTVKSSGFNGNPFCWGVCYHYFTWESVEVIE